MIERDEREKDLPPSDNFIKDIIAFNSDLEDEWVLWDILPSGAINFKPGFGGDLSIMQTKCPMCSFGLPANAKSVFRLVAQGLNHVDEHCKKLER